METLKEFSVIETPNSVMAILSIDDKNVMGFSYDKKTHIDSTCGFSVDEYADEYAVVTETTSILEVTEAYNEYINRYAELDIKEFTIIKKENTYMGILLKNDNDSYSCLTETGHTEIYTKSDLKEWTQVYDCDNSPIMVELKLHDYTVRKRGES